MDAEQTKQLKIGLASQVSLGRMGHPDEIAKAVLFAFDDSSFATGIEPFCRGRHVQRRPIRSEGPKGDRCSGDFDRC